MPPKNIFAHKLKTVFQRRGSKRVVCNCDTAQSTHDAATQPAAATKPPSSDDQRSVERSNELKHTVVNVAKIGLTFLKDSSDVFPPLKSLVGGLAFLLGNHEKWKDNQASLNRLVTRLSDLVNDSGNCGPLVGKAELKRRQELDKTFSALAKDLEVIQTRKPSIRYISAEDESSAIASIIERIHIAITDYMFSLQKDTYAKITRLVSQDDTNLLDKLPRAKNADHLVGSHDMCYPGTRTSILQQLETWIEDPNAKRIFWLGGHAGSGKSTIAQSFCHRTFASGKLGASFFCSRDFVDRSDIKMIFPTLAFQLGCHFPEFRTHLIDILRVRPDIGSEAMANQLTELLVNPLIASGISTTISIEALDEYNDSEPASVILSLLARVVDDLPLIRFFITGRPEAPIRAGFRIPSLRPQTEIIQLHEITEGLDDDITLYLRARLWDIVKHRSDFELAETWPPADRLAILVQKCERLFIFASTVVKLLSSAHPFDPREGLVKLTQFPGNTHYEGMYGIDALYIHVLHKRSSPMTQESYDDLKPILGTIVLAYNPLSSMSISALMQLHSPDVIKTRLGGLHSLLVIPSSSSDPIRVHHKSFPDFLINSERCSGMEFYIDPDIYHAKLAIACLDIMKLQLRKNICSLPRYAMNADVSLGHRCACIGEALDYASRFWVQHLCASNASGELLDALLEHISDFLQECQIFWFEVLSLVDNLQCAMYSLERLENWMLKVKVPWASSASSLDWLGDGFHFITYFYDAIQESAAHLYHSALPLSPRTSLLRQKHAADLISEVSIIRGADHWDSSRIRSVATGIDIQIVTFSHQGALVAVGNGSIIKIFDSMTGGCTVVLEAKIDPWNYSSLLLIKFSFDDTIIISLNRRSEILLWDVQTGSLIKEFVVDDPQNTVCTVDLSLDKQWLASGHTSGTICVWERQSGVILYKAHITGVFRSLWFTCSRECLVVLTATAATLMIFSNQGTFITHCLGIFDYFVNGLLSADRTLLVYTTKEATPTNPTDVQTSPLQCLSVCDLESRCSIGSLMVQAHWRILAIQEHSVILSAGSHLEIINLCDIGDFSTTRIAFGLTFSEQADISWDRRVVAYDDNHQNLYLQKLSPLAGALCAPTYVPQYDYVHISENGAVIAAHSNPDEILVWNMQKNLDLIVSLEVHADSINSISNLYISPNNIRIIVGNRFRRCVVDLSGEPISIVKPLFESKPWFSTFTSFLDEKTHITVGPSLSRNSFYMQIWDVPLGRQLATIHMDGLNCYHWMQVDVSDNQMTIYTRQTMDHKYWQFIPLQSTKQPGKEFSLKATTLPIGSGLSFNLDNLVYSGTVEKQWVLNGHGRRILWLPLEVHQHQQVANMLKWRGSTLAVGGRNLTVMNFSGVDVEINPPTYATHTILGLGRDFICDLHQNYEENQPSPNVQSKTNIGTTVEI